MAKALTPRQAAWTLLARHSAAEAGSYDDLITCKNIIARCLLAAILPKNVLTNGDHS
jgi:hypothetical protein